MRLPPQSSRSRELSLSSSVHAFWFSSRCALGTGEQQQYAWKIQEKKNREIITSVSVGFLLSVRHSRIILTIR